MKKLLVITLIIFVFTNTINSQEIVNVNYGEKYLDFREMGFREFSRNQYSYKSPKSRSIRERFAHDKIIYLLTPFLNELNKKNKGISNEYKNDILSMKNEFSKSIQKGYWSQFENGTKKAYDFLMLHLEKFEILSEHYKELFNFELLASESKEEIRKSNILLDTHYSKIIKKCKQNEYEKNKELHLLEKTSEEQIKKVESFFKNKETELGREIKGKINKLSPSNYEFNKRVIINDYKPILIELSLRKKDSLGNLKSFWNDKIKDEIATTEKAIKSKVSIIEDSRLTKKDSIRKKVRAKFDLKSKEDLIFVKHDSLINSINERIKK